MFVFYTIHKVKLLLTKLIFLVKLANLYHTQIRKILFFYLNFNDVELNQENINLTISNIDIDNCLF